MENEYYKSIQTQLKGIEDKVHAEEVSYRDLSTAVTDLRRIIADLQEDVNESGKEYTAVMTSVDKDLAVQSEKLSNIFYQLGQLEKRISTLEASNAKESDKSKEYVEKVFMAVFGAAVTYIFNLLQK